MSSESSEPLPPDPHADKFSDPRVSITRRGVLMGVGVGMFAIVGAGLSIYARKTPLEQTTEFWGQETITALQLGERMQLLPRGAAAFDPVELTATPGLGLLRRALLDSRNFDWASVEPTSVASACGSVKDQPDPTCLQLRITDPTGHRFSTIEIDIDLINGWIGPGDGSQRVRMSERLQTKLKNYFATVIHVKQKRYDLRAE